MKTMMRMKRLSSVILSLAIITCIPANAQSLNLKIGLWNPDMNSDLWDTNMENLALNKQDMRDPIYALEYEMFFQRRFAVTFELAHYEKEHYSAYKDYEYEDGSPINQNLALTITSVELNLKIYPTTYQRMFNPFIGAGVGIYHWVYEQWGDFINFDDFTVQEGYADTSTYTAGLNARAGFVLRFRKSVGFSFEARYQYLKGQLSSLFDGFEKLDMNGLALYIGLNLFL